VVVEAGLNGAAWLREQPLASKTSPARRMKIGVRLLTLYSTSAPGAR
jgi:hypothetical protein